MEKINEGAEAVIYSAELVGANAILKRRIKKDYRIKEIDDRIRSTRSRNEARIIALASRSGINAPKLLLSDGYDIYMTPLSGERLDSYMKRARSNQIFNSVGQILGALHNSDIAHGDYTPANILVKGTDAQVIDFGLAQTTESIETKALDVLLMKRSLNRSQYTKFISAYRATSSNSKEILKRLDNIERRGRYQTRTLAT